MAIINATGGGGSMSNTPYTTAMSNTPYTTVRVGERAMRMQSLKHDRDEGTIFQCSILKVQPKRLR